MSSDSAVTNITEQLKNVTIEDSKDFKDSSISDSKLTPKIKHNIELKSMLQSNPSETRRNPKPKNSGDALIESLLTSIKTKQKINAVAYVDDPLCDKHEFVIEGHQESKSRTRAVRSAIKDYKLDRFTERAGSISIAKGNLINVHALDYIDTLFKSGKFNKPVVIPSPSTEISMSNIDSLGSVLAAAASVMGAVNVVCGNYEIKKNKKNYINPRIRKVFCNVRPPGHHAHKEHGAGFCFINNVAIGADFAMTKYNVNVKKVFIFDWDLHHGDGTQDIFKNNHNVMCSSFHRGGEGSDYFYPGTGLVHSNKAGNIINFPIGRDETVDSYMKKFNEELLPMAYKFDPDLVMISAGFDSHKDDLYHALPLDYCHFAEMTRSLAQLADKCALGRLVSVLEGGYTSDVLRKCAAVHIATLIDGYDENK